MFRNLRIYLKLRPYLTELGKEVHMKFSWNLVIQILGTIGQGLNAVGGMLPPKSQVLVASALAIIQGVSGLIAHFSNPDGTKATTAYTP